MYTPISNIVVTTAMRWPSLGLAITTIGGLMADSGIGQGIAWIASVGLGSYLLASTQKKHFCDCEGEAIKKGMPLLPQVEWVVEYHPDSGSKRPWELYSMFGGDEDTKQHYASYSTEEHALERKEILEKATTITHSPEQS